jgi:HAMP domain-containing protein
MRPSPLLPTLFRGRRPILRVQLTLLYSGLVLAILAAVLLATNLLYRHSASAAPTGAPADQVVGPDRQFDVGPALIGLVAAVLAVAGAWWLAGRFLRPLRAITTTAQEISATNLHQRLTLTGPSDELTELGTTLNGLFQRLEASFDAQRHFVANASHELRTPWPGSAPCSKSRWPIPTPAPTIFVRPAKKPSNSVLSKNSSSTPYSPWPPANAASNDGSRSTWARSPRRS